MISAIMRSDRSHCFNDIADWRTDLELALQFFLDPLSDMSEGDLPLPERGTHMKV